MAEFFDKLKVGNTEPENRIVMSPMTRRRAAASDQSTFCTSGEKGYTDYPTLERAAAA